MAILQMEFPGRRSIVKKFPKAHFCSCSLMESDLHKSRLSVWSMAVLRIDALGPEL